MTLDRALRGALIVSYATVIYPLVALRRATHAVRPDRAWRSWISEDILLGGFLLPGDVVELSSVGIGAVVNVTHELVDPTRTLRDAQIDYLRVPCWDTRAPTPDDAKRGVAFIAGHIEAKRRVYVHCASGVGRSVALAICYLATHGGLSLDEATAQVTAMRPRVAMRPGQRDFIRAFVAAHTNGG